MNRKVTLFFVLTFAVLCLANVAVEAQSLTTGSPNLPPPAGTYISPQLYHQLYAIGIVIKDIKHQDFTANQPPPPPGGFQLHTFNSTVFFNVSFDGGMTYSPGSAPANCAVAVQSTPTKDIGTTRAFDTEMLQLNLSGGTLPGGVMIRESPTLQSLGKTHITQDGVQYHIDSFFDIFTELSIDGGMTWMPATNGAGHMALQGDPEPPVVTTNPNLPLNPSHYVSPTEWHQLYAAGIVVKDISHDRFTNNDPPPDTGAAGSTHSFGSNVRMQVSNDGGMTWNTVNAPATVQVHMHKNTGSSGTPIGTYDTEMLTLDITGGGLPAGVMIRESPTLASTGKTTIKAAAGGGGKFEVNSFFDIFTELTTDGGMTWSPGQYGPTHMAIEPDPPPVVENSPNIPPSQDHYVSPAAWHQAYQNGIIIRDVSHEKFLTNDPPPAAETTHTFGSGVTMEISTDGGMTFNPSGASGDVTVHIKHKNNDPSTNTDYYETEMLALDLNGGPGVMVRESPSLPSKGKTSIRQLPGGQYAIGSFFDVFTELSTDGGMTWSPATGPAQMELQIDSGMICGRKYEDLNGDGSDVGDAGLAGWKVQITDQGSGTVYSAVTDGAGNYCCKVPPGTYRVEEVLQAGWTQTGGQPYYTVTVPGGATIGGKDFGNFKSGSICGVKFNDLNGNGVRDSLEPGLAGWTICIQRNQPPPSGTFPTTGGTDFMGNTQAFIDMDLSAAYGGQHIKLCAAGNSSVQRAAPSGNTAADSMLTEITLLDMVGTLPPPYAPTDTFHIRHKTDRRSFGQIQGNSFPAVSFFDVFYELSLPASLGGGTYVNYTATQMGTTINTVPPSGQSYLGVGSYIINKANPADTLGQITFVNHCLAGQQAGAHCDTCPKPPPNPTPPGSPLGTTCVVTDANGNFCFTDLPPGTYTIGEIPQAGWTMTSLPPAPIIVESNTASLGNDFGNHSDGCTVCVTKYWDANHNQKVPHDPSDPPMSGVQFTLVTSANDTLVGVTDVNGQVCFSSVPAGPSVLTEALPAGYTYSVPKSGVMNFDVDCSGGSMNIEWQNASAMVDSTFRSATSEQWATALDLKAKRKALKCKPIKVDFKLNLVVPGDSPAGTPYTHLKIGFNMATQITGIWADGKNKSIPLTCLVPGAPDPKQKIFTYDVTPMCVLPGMTIQFDGVGLKGSVIKAAYVWSTTDAKPLVIKGSLSPVPKGGVPGDELKEILRLPMPNLNNVGEELFAQGAFPILVAGASSDSNVVLLKKYNDAVKALGKDNKGTIILHDSLLAADCFHKLAKLGKPKSGLSPDKINNKLFAEILALKLNVLASQHGKFPVGFDSLIYDYHKVTPGPFDGQPIASILQYAEHYLRTCEMQIMGETAENIYFTLRLINRSFAGPVDTVRWSCDKLQLTGVRTLKDVPWLTANPGTTVPVIAAPEGRVAPYQVPESYSLHQNYPNPFNPTTTISFDLPEQAVVTLKVYNTLGQEVAVLINHEVMDEGTEDVEFDASGLPSGVYFYRIIAQGVVDEEGTAGQTFLDVKKMMLLK
ncbi:MAG TPA: T9SS type A sorting domain-containing protein [Bacteroidota bacterium]|nr:T9SS type A sorting domain-containing protein [Bacteroidota bacterium]